MNGKERKLVLEKLLQEQDPDNDDNDCEVIAGTLNVPKERVRNILITVRQQNNYDREKMKRALKIAVSGLVLFLCSCSMIFSKFWLAALSPSFFSAALLLFLDVFALSASCIVLVMTLVNPIEKE